ncbi:MAG: serine protease [Nitrososphaerota archaeon]|jgi:V8-like Glu-specific endopeptidase|nr:serine protease [Nitrososphaerota archaeon]
MVEKHNIGKTLHPIYVSTTIIKFGHCSSATGFFFSENNETYLVTNKHVIDNCITSDIDEIKIMLHTNSYELTDNEEIAVKLYDGAGNKKWLEHETQEVDVILIPVKLESKHVYAPLSRDFIAAKEYQTLFEKILVVGYPYGWYDVRNNLPIIRVGNLSSPFGIGFNGEKFMIGDVITHPGMSGAPVIMQLVNPVTKENKQLFQTRYVLIGIYSGQSRINHIDEKERPQLITIWFAELIFEILSNLH